MICRCESANNVFLGIDRWVLGWFVCTGTVGEASYFGAEIGVAEEGDGLASRGDGLSLADLFGRRRNNAMQSRTEDIVTPAGEQVSNVDDNGVGLCIVQYGSQRSATERYVQWEARRGRLGYAGFVLPVPQPMFEI